MSNEKDSFDDDELTSMAADIMQDFATKANDDPTVSNPYLYLFSDDEIGSVDKLPSISMSFSSDGHTIHKSRPVMSPRIRIISDSKLLPNDSFNHSLPPIPSNSEHSFNRNINTNTLPYIRPPSIFIQQSSSYDCNDCNDISRCISPRYHTKKATECHAQIPDFGDENEINIDICNKYKSRNHKKQKYKNKNKNRPKKKMKNKTRSDDYLLKRVASPIHIDFDRNVQKWNQFKIRQPIKQSVTTLSTAKSPKRPKVERKNKKINKKNRDRARSVGVHVDEYAVECEHGFMFVNTDNV